MFYFNALCVQTLPHACVCACILRFSVSMPACDPEVGPQGCLHLSTEQFNFVAWRQCGTTVLPSSLTLLRERACHAKLRLPISDKMAPLLSFPPPLHIDENAKLQHIWFCFVRREYWLEMCAARHYRPYWLFDYIYPFIFSAGRHWVGCQIIWLYTSVCKGGITRLSVKITSQIKMEDGDRSKIKA